MSDKAMSIPAIFLVVSVLFPPWLQAQDPDPGKERIVTLFDFDWLFHRGGAQWAEMPSFNDAEWRKVDLPHDWSIEDIPGTSSPFDADAVGQVSTGFTAGGTAWYRKRFTLPPMLKDKHLYIQFDGVYMNADVWLNGVHLGTHPYGYTSFWFDITPYVEKEKENVLAVQVKNEGQNSRWYSGSGIYRHVWLTAVEPVHVDQWGTYVTTPEVSASSAQVKVKTRVRNTTRQPATVTLVTTFLSADGQQVARVQSQSEVPADTTADIVQQARIPSPERWSPESPSMYDAVSQVRVGNNVADEVRTSFGIRQISFDPEKGFQLNGHPMELKGGCVHHDNGPLGARAYDRAEERRVELLKASGFNAIRCAHNPPSPAFLEACDRLGMLVIDEAFDMWVNPNNPFDYHLYFEKWWQRDVQSMLMRDRNHPSIIMWSIGNEIKGMETPHVVKVANTLARYVHEEEPTRPVTAAVNGVNEKKDPFFAALDVAGYNYSRDQYVADHKRKPERIMFCTESFPLEAYEYWMGAKDNAWVIGDFVWTSFDYIGEASIGWRGYMQKKNFYPWTLAYCGDIDICGDKRPQSYYRDVLWKDTPQLSIFVKPPHPSFPPNPERETWSKWHWHDVVADWNWKGYEHTPLEVNVYSSCESVELFLNGKSLGKKPTGNANEFVATWQVPYEPGELKAVGYVGRKKVNTAQLRSAGAASQISMTADRTVLKADGQSLSYITVELLDDNGIRNPKAEDLIHFGISGPGQIIAVANANPMATESFQGKTRKAWRGKCLVIVRSDRKAGEVIVKADAAGMKGSHVVINVE